MRESAEAALLKLKKSSENWPDFDFHPAFLNGSVFGIAVIAYANKYIESESYGDRSIEV